MKRLKKLYKSLKTFQPKGHICKLTEKNHSSALGASPLFTLKKYLLLLLHHHFPNYILITLLTFNSMVYLHHIASSSCALHYIIGQCHTPTISQIFMSCKYVRKHLQKIECTFTCKIVTLKDYPSKFPVQKCECHIKYIGANNPQKNEDKKKQSIQFVQMK